MKNFTLSLIAIIAMSLSASAQNSFGIKAGANILKKAERYFTALDDKLLMRDEFEFDGTAVITERFVTTFKPRVEGNIAYVDDVRVICECDATLNVVEQPFVDQLPDENGSYKDTCVAYKDLNGDGEFAEDELDYSDEINVTYDNAGRVTEEVYSVFDVISSAARYEYTYSPDYGNYPVEQVYYYYDVQNSEYVPYMKLIADDFYDVCAGIDEINVDNSSACVIYNLQGIKINSLEQDLPSGVYIIKQNGKTVKVAK